MNSTIFKTVIGLSVVTSISILIFNNIKEETIPNRWYTPTQVNLGEKVFSDNCAVCHGEKAEKTIDWKKTLADGSYPPPPLNDKAHAWHHPKWQMIQIITEGGKQYKGNMPAFGDKLTSKEKEAAIAFFQTFWDDKHYNLWIKYGGLKDK